MASSGMALVSTQQALLKPCAGAGRRTHVPFTSSKLPAAVTSCRRHQAIVCQSSLDLPRRRVLELAGATTLLTLIPGQAWAKPPKGFLLVKDSQDGYEFYHPFGWQEVTVTGQDVVYKDIIEPLESVSVSITTTDKADVTEFGPPEEVAVTLATSILTPPNQEVKVLDVAEKEKNGRKYIEFEFAAKAPTYIRHAYAVVTVGNGKFYTLTTGANEKRWGKMKPRLQEILGSFNVEERFGN